MNPFKWHQWFAWHPITVQGKIVWMQRVERKFWQYNSWDKTHQGVDYRHISYVKEGHAKTAYEEPKPHSWHRISDDMPP